ncbi:MAG: hypothetical protein ACI9HK_001900 [Pirellulaceae bacterium]|jgi:hypothetical protein
MMNTLLLRLSSWTLVALTLVTLTLVTLTLVTGVCGQQDDAAKNERKAERKSARKLNSKIENSIAAGLSWLAAQQLPDGSWNYAKLVAGQDGAGESVDAGNAATGMALLCFAKAGQTHVEGEYKQVVAKGTKYLLSKMKTDGSFHEPRGSMYSHGIAAQAIITLFKLTEDKTLQKPAQSALDFIAYAQDPVEGGWRYSPKQPGDTSVSCWQIQALVVGKNVGLKVSDETVGGATKFLDAVQSEKGVYYGYTTPGRGMATSAQGLLCRIQLGWDPADDRVKTGVAALSKQGPSQGNHYYNLFATQLLQKHGGKAWQAWQAWRSEIVAQLIADQQKEKATAGSWLVTKGGHGVQRGGRLYCTAMALMVLETAIEKKVE